MQSHDAELEPEEEDVSDLDAGDRTDDAFVAVEPKETLFHHRRGFAIGPASPPSELFARLLEDQEDPEGVVDHPRLPHDFPELPLSLGADVGDPHELRRALLRLTRLEGLRRVTDRIRIRILLLGNRYDGAG